MIQIQIQTRKLKIFEFINKFSQKKLKYSKTSYF